MKHPPSKLAFILLVFSTQISLAQVPPLIQYTGPGAVDGFAKARESINKEIYLKLLDTTSVSYDFEFPAWEKDNKYFQGDLVLFQGKVYESKVDLNQEDPGQSENWEISIPAMTFSNIDLSYKIVSSYFFYDGESVLKTFKGERDSAGRIIIKRPVIFKNCVLNFDLGLSNFNFQRGITFQDCKIGRLTLRQTTAREVNITNCNSGNIGINGCNIQTLIIENWNSLDQVQTKPNFHCKNSEFKTLGISSPPDELVVDISQTKITGIHEKSFYMGESSNRRSKGAYTLKLDKTEIGTAGDSTISSLQGYFIDIFMDSCTLNSNLNFYSSMISNKLYLTNNKINGLLAINNATLPPDIKIRWTQVKGERLAAFTKSGLSVFKYGFYTDDEKFVSSSKGVSQTDYYEDIMKSYQVLYNVYRLAGDLESANSCFAEMKDVQTKRLHTYIQKTNPLNRTSG